MKIRLRIHPIPTLISVVLFSHILGFDDVTSIAASLLGMLILYRLVTI